MIRKLLTSIIFCFVIVPFALAQSGSITGTVTDSQTGETLPGTNVSLSEMNRGASTDANGTYTISNVPAGTYTLRVSFIGYKTQSQQVEVGGGETVANIQLDASNLQLDQMVVTGYGEVAKDKYTGTISTVTSESIEDSPVASVGQALKGNVAGANISAASGTPGSPQQIRIRGISSINAGTAPLYVIDGVPINNFSTGGNGSSPLGTLSSLSPSDIKSVSVLKGAAATAPYGARGSNGVIVIETKDGKNSKTTYSVSAQVGTSNPAVSGPATVTGAEWDQFYRTAKANDPSNNLTPEQVDDSPWDGQTNTNWRDVLLNRDALQQKYSLSARGGNDQTTFYASGSYFNQEGSAIGVNFDRIAGKLNVTHKLDDRITIDNKLTGSYVDQEGITEGSAYFANPMTNIYFSMPIDPVYNDDGSPNLNLSNNHYNAVYIQNNHINQKRNYRLLNNSKIDVQLMDNFLFSTRFNADFTILEGKSYRDPVYGGGASLNGTVSDYTDRNFNYVWRNTLDYIWTLDDINSFDFKAIAESQHNEARYLSGYGTGVAALGLVNLNTVANPQDVASSTYDWSVQSYTGLANYSYNDKILVDASIRYEGSSRFSENERWGAFWSLGAGYILSEEPFLEDVSWVDFLKLRASYGKTGNASIGLNQYQAIVGFGSYNGQADILLDGLGNKNLTWENQKLFEAGFEFRTLDNRVELSTTFFRQDSYDMLFDVPLSRTTGFNSQTQNLGKLYNQGLELEFSADVVQKDKISWNLGANFTTLKNEVTQLPTDSNGNPRQITSSTRYTAVEGYEVRAWYMKEWAGVDPENGDPLWYVNDENGGRTTTNDYNAADSYYQGGNAQPTQFGGVNTRVDFFGFYASADLSYQFGHKVYDSWGLYLENGGDLLYYGRYASQMDYWKQPGDRARNPKPTFGGNRNSNAVSSRYLYDGDYLRLTTLNIGYTIPARFLQKAGLSSASVFFLGENLWTHAFDEDLKFDPDVNAGGFLNFQGAALKSLTFGIKADF